MPAHGRSAPVGGAHASIRLRSTLSIDIFRPGFSDIEYGWQVAASEVVRARRYAPIRGSVYNLQN